MKRGAGKNKGSAFEREVCNVLSRYIDPKSQDTLFWRSAISGGRATVQNKKGFKNSTQLGDITAVHSKGQWLTATFIIEVKFYKKLDLEACFISGKGKVAGFWRKLVKDAASCDRKPMLIAKQNHTPTLLFLDKEGVNFLKAFGAPVGTYTLIFYNNTRPVYVLVFKEVFGHG